MLLPSRQDRTSDPLEGLTTKQVRISSARLFDQESYGQIALREGISRMSAWRLVRRAIRNIRRNGWDITSPLFRAA
jgi:DNA-directed RNA polymerase specialized sigma24 family protein